MPILMLGQVVTELKLTSEAEVDRALRFAKATGSPLGQALVAQEIISPSVLRACVQAQWMLSDQLLTVDECQAVIALVQRRKWRFNDALLTLGFYCEESKGLRLGELLVASGLLSTELVNKALERATSACLPLGRAIVSFDFLEQSTIDKVLEIQKSLRQSEIDLESALHEVAKLRVSSQALSKTSRILTRLLIEAELVTIEDVQSYHTAAVTTGRGLADMLYLYSNLQPQHLFVLSSIARRIESGTLNYRDGVRLALQHKEHCDNDSSNAQASSQTFSYQPGKISFYVYLRMLDYLNADTAQDLIGFMSANRDLVERLIGAQTKISGASVDESAQAGSNWKTKIRFCIESDDLLYNCLLEAFSSDREKFVKARELLQLVNSNCLTLEESLFWSHGQSVSV
ncbi:hypothetical protein BH11CYA1_BH11CYA1_48960 [soil metagenome]